MSDEQQPADVVDDAEPVELPQPGPYPSPIDRDRLVYAAGYLAAVGIACLVLVWVVRRNAKPCPPADADDVDQVDEQLPAGDDVIARTPVVDVIEAQRPDEATREQLTQLDPVTAEERAAWAPTVVEVPDAVVIEAEVSPNGSADAVRVQVEREQHADADSQDGE